MRLSRLLEDRVAASPLYLGLGLFTNEATNFKSSPHVGRYTIRGKPDRKLKSSRHNPLSAKDIFGLETGTIMCPGRKDFKQDRVWGRGKKSPACPPPAVRRCPYVHGGSIMPPSEDFDV